MDLPALHSTTTGAASRAISGASGRAVRGPAVAVSVPYGRPVSGGGGMTASRAGGGVE